MLIGLIRYIIVIYFFVGIVSVSSTQVCLVLPSSPTPKLTFAPELTQVVVVFVRLPSLLLVVQVVRVVPLPAILTVVVVHVDIFFLLVDELLFLLELEDDTWLLCDELFLSDGDIPVGQVYSGRTLLLCAKAIAPKQIKNKAISTFFIFVVVGYIPLTHRF